MFTAYKLKFSCWGRGDSSLTEGKLQCILRDFNFFNQIRKLKYVY